MNCQGFSISNVAFAASWTHKHDGANTPKLIKIIIVDVGSGETGNSSYVTARGDKQDIFLRGRYKIDQ